MNTKEKAEIWKEYFDKLLNTEESRELIKKGNEQISKVEVEVEELTIEDVKKAIRNLKNSKAAGTDGIHLKLIKYGGNKLLNRMYEPVRPTNPITGLDRPYGFQEVEDPRFEDNQHMKMLRLSVVCTGYLYPQEIFQVLISVRS